MIMSSLPSFPIDQPLSDFSATGRKKITDAFINQAYKELVENPVDSYNNMDVQSPSIPISFLYDLSNENSRSGGNGLGLLRTASSSDLASFSLDESFSYDEFEKRGEFIMPSMPVERSLSAPCIASKENGGGDNNDEGGGQITLKDFDKQLLAHVAASSSHHAPNSSIFNNQYKYEFIMDAPISIVQRKGDDTLTYLNKGQYYCISFLSNPNTIDRLDFNLRVKTIIHLVFRNQDRKKEYEYWTYWYAQQPNANIRVFDVDERSCKNVEEINEIGCNAVSFTWNSNIGAKIVLRINCLSTEFSSQKGVKGTPLYVQVDTFEDTESLNPEPADRCYCQIKVFRDKGAERKNKDESRTAERKLQKLLKNGQLCSSDKETKDLVSVFHKPCKQTVLTKTTVLSPKPVIFTAPVRNLSFNVSAPEDMSPVSDQKYYPATTYVMTSPTFSSQNTFIDVGSVGSSNSISDQSEVSWSSSPGKQHDNLFALIRERETKRTISQALTAANEGAQHLTIGAASDHPNRPNKVARIQKPRPVTIYVKKSDEKIYNALCMGKLSLENLKEEVAAKYSLPKNMVAKFYKRTKRGLLIHMDDRMVEQFEDEDDFNIEISFQNKEGIFEVTFVY